MIIMGPFFKKKEEMTDIYLIGDKNSDIFN